MTSEEMNQRSRAAQVKKYGGEKPYRAEMARRGKAGNSIRWSKKKDESKETLAEN